MLVLVFSRGSTTTVSYYLSLDLSLGWSLLISICLNNRLIHYLDSLDLQLLENQWDLLELTMMKLDFRWICYREWPESD